MDIKTILTNMGILGLFVFSIMSFVIITQTDNSVTTPITNDSRIGNTYSNLQSNLDSSKTSTSEASDNFGKIPPTQEFGEIEVTSIVSPTATAKSIILGMWNIFIVLPQQVLGISSTVANIIGAILLVFIIIGIWAIWKGVVS